MEQQTNLEVVAPHALELIERAQIDMQISTAKKYPRDLAKVKKRMLDFATLDEETAESCFYTLSRKDSNGDVKTIQGPSVRFAEIAVACYQNLRAGARIVDNDGKAVTSQAVCHDLENNVSVTMEVRRRITNRYGKTYSEDMQIVTGNAACAIAFRNAVFKVVPGALVKPVYETAKKVAVGDASTLSTKRAKMIARLNSMQVTTERILHKLGKTSVENIGLEDLELLIGLGTAIKDGETTVDAAFPAEEQVVKAAIDPGQVTPSTDPNRGHGQAAPPAVLGLQPGEPWAHSPEWDALASQVTDLCVALDRPADVGKHIALAKGFATNSARLASLRASVETLAAEYRLKQEGGAPKPGPTPITKPAKGQQPLKGDWA